MKKYSLGFGIFYLILSIILNFIAGKVNLRNGVFSLVVVFLLTTAASCIFSAWWFTKKEDCRPTPEEEISFAWQSVLCIWLIMFLFLVVPVNAQIKSSFSQNGYLLFLLSRVVVAAVYALLHYFFILYIFSWYAKITHDD